MRCTCAYSRGFGSNARLPTPERPLLSANLALACATAVLVYLVATVGAAVIAFSGVILIAYSRLQRDLLQAERHAETARQLAADAQDQRDGLVRIILDFLDARDQMTARHSAAVARYARRIAEAAGCPEAEQRLVHTAALYHDVGKVMFADRMLKAGKLTDEEWEIVKRHPERGAELVGHLPNHEDVAAIILAHHGASTAAAIRAGSPARTSAPVAHDLDRRHLRRHDRARLLSPARQLGRGDRGAAPRGGAQLDGSLVEIFVEQVLAVEDLAFRHGDDADFEAELAVERDGRGVWRPVIAHGGFSPPASKPLRGVAHRAGAT